MGKKIGQIGEQVLSQWLIAQAWQILAQNWHCSWGELDLIAQTPAGVVAFIEVKTRQSQSLDQGGLMAITPAKQRKIIHTAQLFLEQYPDYAALPCRFDVALVQYQSITNTQNFHLPLPTPGLEFLGQRGPYRFFLLDYLTDAFTP
ncbi:YraN family protein [Thermosynechococcaceae cyanobacterium BACA0444]|uniref:UPF0102 protein RIF25_15345 n=1 Tax=Pseudocalidococcus azoricus BACA0444 TaxID=2918990 RepID=A0AAE4FW65_9CYAN|nr:YraN family protein [Pseudocalidococcus azoricus]MDS3862176.1 YraN family protein [Pseudocalidococcus azoricus BACA0444]